MKTDLSKKKYRVGIQGVEGCFHHEAANIYFNNPEVIPCLSFDQLIDKTLDETQTDFSVMAIENSIAGSIIPNYNLLMSSGLHVVGEVYTRIGQNLLVPPTLKMEEILEIHSHPMALLQCKQFLKKYPKIKLVETNDTAGSAKNIMELNLKNTAAIAGQFASEIYGLKVLESNIETVHNNYTRFLILSRNPIQYYTGVNKASVYAEIAHEKGSLARLLVLLSEANINLSKLQSYPIIGSTWSYGFYLDMEFEDKKVLDDAWALLSREVNTLKLLGVYKNGK